MFACVESISHPVRRKSIFNWPKSQTMPSFFPLSPAAHAAADFLVAARANKGIFGFGWGAHAAAVI